MIENYQKMSLKELAEHMQFIHNDMDRANTRFHTLKAEWNKLRKKHLPEKMKEMGIEKVGLTDIGTVSLRQDAECTVAKNKMPELCDWLESKGYGNITYKSIDVNKFEIFMKEQTFLGLEKPSEELASFTVYTYAKITR